MPDEQRCGAPTKVAFVDHTAELSGGEIALLQMLIGFGDSIEALVILGADGPLVDRLAEIGIRSLVAPLPRSAARFRVSSGIPSPRSAVSLAPYIRRLSVAMRSADIVHTNSMKAHLYGGVAANLARKPLVWHVRDRLSPDYMSHLPLALARVAAMVVPDAVIANSQTTLGLIPGGRAKHRRAIASPIDDKFFDLEPRPPQGALRVGIVGRLVPWKGQHLFLEAFARSFRSSPDVRGVVIGAATLGDRGYEDELRRHAEELGIAEQMEWRGFQSDVPREMGNLDVVVHTSTVPEPFGQVVAQGMAAGRLVIAVGEGGPSEFVEHDQDGLLFKRGDVADLSRCLALSTDPTIRTRLGSAARRKAEQFRRSVIVAEVKCLYADVCT